MSMYVPGSTGRKKFNKTQLNIDKATERGIVHRDYLAHCLRWTHVLRNAKMGQRILDVGCGLNTPLAWTLYTNKFRPEMYLGLDIRFQFQFSQEDFPFPYHLEGRFDATDADHWENVGEKYGFHQSKGFDVVVCFETLEHMNKDLGIALLQNVSVYGQGSKIFLSTPVFNGSQAENHIHEWEYEELRSELVKYFTIEDVFGTFASQSEICPLMSPDELQVFEKLKTYYDSNMMSVIFAPLHPTGSRNCMWRLRSR